MKRRSLTILTGVSRSTAAITAAMPQSPSCPPGDAWKGDILLADGSIRTMQGGNIDVLVPGGSLQMAALVQRAMKHPDRYGLTFRKVE